jgi:hypothetical protein
VSKVWSLVPELTEVGSKHEVAQECIDLYEVARPGVLISLLSSSADNVPPHSRSHSSIIPSTASTSTFSGSASCSSSSSRKGEGGGVSYVLTGRHSAVAGVCPHPTANLPIIPSTNVQYFLPQGNNQVALPPSDHIINCDMDIDNSSSQQQDQSISSPLRSSLSSSSVSSPSCRLVELSRHSAICPNCGDHLQPIPMSAEDVHHVKTALTDLTTSASAVAGEKLKVSQM